MLSPVHGAHTASRRNEKYTGRPAVRAARRRTLARDADAVRVEQPFVDLLAVGFKVVADRD